MEDINKHNYDFTEYKTVFCDSLEALAWAYQNELPHDSIIRTSSPAMLWEENPNIIHVESHWNPEKMREFQTTIQSFSEEVYDKVMLTNCATHEESLVVAKVAVNFHKLLFKAACLSKEDLVEPRLFVSVDANEVPGGNNMNSPWDQLLTSNSKFRMVTCRLKNNKWNTFTTKGIPFWNRMRIGGVETLIYRLLINLTNKLPNALFRRQVLVLNENELLIETAAALALKGVRVRKINPNKKKSISKNINQLLLIKKSIQSSVNQRINLWVEPSLVGRCEELFFQEIEETLNSFMKFRTQWSFLNKESKRHKTVLLINASGNTKGLAITSLCSEAEIPVVSFQHGVTHEICATHGEVSVNYEINNSDLFVAYNKESEKIFQKSHFIKGTSFVSGISARHSRMESPFFSKISKTSSPIVYVSTNIYRGNLSNFNTWQTDYGRALREQHLLTNVFGKLPHKVRYKSYPEDNQHYADDDPVIAKAHTEENIDLFNNKIDMRYLLSQHRILVTSVATSTLGWLIMSGKPVVFINWHDDGPLTKNTHDNFSKGLFLFDNNMGFHDRLRDFLSLTIDEIEELWDQKKDAREDMIKQYISSHAKNAGKRTASVICDRYF